MRDFCGATTAKLFPCSLKTRDLGSMMDKVRCEMVSRGIVYSGRIGPPQPKLLSFLLVTTTRQKGRRLFYLLTGGLPVPAPNRVSPATV